MVCSHLKCYIVKYIRRDLIWDMQLSLFTRLSVWSTGKYSWHHDASMAEQEWEFKVSESLFNALSSVTWQWPPRPQIYLRGFYDIYLKQNLIKYLINLTFNISLNFLFPLKLFVYYSLKWIHIVLKDWWFKSRTINFNSTQKQWPFL